MAVKKIFGLRKISRTDPTRINPTVKVWWLPKLSKYSICIDSEVFVNKSRKLIRDLGYHSDNVISLILAQSDLIKQPLLYLLHVWSHLVFGFLVFFGILWYSLVFFGILWYSLVFFGILWDSLVFFGILWYFKKCLNMFHYC